MSIPQGGISPAASFELAGHEPQLGPPTIFADDIDPVTGDFRSLTRGVGVADGLATFLLTVQRGSGAAVRTFGHRFREVTHADGKAPETIESFAKEALRPGVESGTLRLERVVAEIDSGDGTQTNTQIEYIDQLAKRSDPSRRKTFNT